ncbi:hypothetical protein Cylst_3399 [Cylindrospermum stagnale PCC 7417]|uniref:Uncharacterized protein n=1 Tax=Cylindrospermum stagnale PCC 7417 TaxID=56107 RepID=K9X0F1_9NOST|nr:hypothetical protein Cylst_3399 [Cylindrospermum stagnale PCC 7417]
MIYYPQRSFICLSLLIFCLSGSYEQKQKLNTNVPKSSNSVIPQISNKESSIQLNYIPKLTWSIPWGNDIKSIPQRPYENMPLSGKFITKSRRMIRPVYSIRLDKNKNLYILFEVPQETEPDERKYRVMRFNSQGNFIDQLDLSVNANSIDRWDIVDFYPDHQNGIYLLEILETNQHKLSHRLRRINSQGKDIWVKQGELNYQKLDFPSFAGKFESLIAPDENSLYLPVRSPKQGLASFDVATGEILAVYNWDEPSDKLTISSAK